MKISATLVLLFSAPALFAGVTYDFQNKSTGMQQRSVAGTVAVEGRNIRMDVTSGEDFLFKKNSIILSNDGGQTLSVFDPALKTYYVINLNALAGNAGGLLNSFGDMVKVSFSNPRVSTRDLGDGEPLSGYPTRRAAVDSSYDISIDAMGNKMTTLMTMTTESWTTDKLSGDFMNFLQMKNLRTGYEELDKLIEAQSDALRGRFPLKQVTTIRLKQGTNDIASTTTSEVSHIEKKTVPASTFAMPPGYIKVDDPVTRMMKNLK